MLFLLSSLLVHQHRAHILLQKSSVVFTHVHYHVDRLLLHIAKNINETRLAILFNVGTSKRRVQLLSIVCSYESLNWCLCCRYLLYCHHDMLVPFVIQGISMISSLLLGGNQLSQYQSIKEIVKDQLSTCC